MSDIVRLEGFSTPLKGQSLWLCGSTTTLEQLVTNRLAVLEEELLGRGRTILMLHNTSAIPLRWTHKVKWDSVFRIRDSQDLRLAVSFIQNSVKPSRVVWIGDEPPNTLHSFFANSDVTFIVGSITFPRGNWGAIFWHPSAEQKQIEDALAPRIGLPAVQKLNLSSVLRELRASNVGLVWSSIGESDKHGTCYWYDAEEIGSVGTFEPVEAAEILRDVADYLLKK
jgi:hypothetical protein